MVLYDFRARFVDAIVAGEKTQTIRAPRKNRHAFPGETLHLYTGLRTPKARLIGRATCKGALDVEIDFSAERIALLSSEEGGPRRIHFSGPKMLDDFARRDGFADFADMAATFAKLHPKSATKLSGVLISWRDFVPALASARQPEAAI